MPLDLKHIERIKLNKGEYVFEEGRTPESVHVLRRGGLELLRNKQVVRTIESIEIPIGNLDLLLDTDRTYSARATEHSEIIFTDMSKGALREWLIDHPQKHLSELRNLAAVLDQVNKENRDLFGQFRELRDVFSPFLKPLRMIYARESDKVELSSRLGKLLHDYLEIIDQAGKSGTIAVDDLTVSDKVKERFTPGEEICTEGEPGEDLYLHLNGSLSVLKDGQMVSSIEKAGLIFGEMAAFLNDERTATVVAETEATVACLPIQDLSNLFESSPKIAKKINRMLLKRYEKALVLEEQLSRFVENLGAMFKKEQELQNERKQLAGIVDNLRGRNSNHEETEEYLDDLEQWLKSDLEDDRDTLFEVLGGTTDNEFSGTI